jgi:hypothetical protein
MPEALRSSRHNTSCRLVHAAIHKTAKGGGALHNAPDLIMVMTDAGTQAQTSDAFVASLSSTVADANPDLSRETPPTDWLAPLTTTKDTYRRRHPDVSQDPRYQHWGLSSDDGDAECTTAPRRIPDRVFLLEETQASFQAGHGTTPDLIYARGVTESPSLDPIYFDRKHYTLIIVKIGF